MAINPYSPCPCGSGKKLKFCCNDLAPEIEKVHRWVSGDQPHAALKHVEMLLAKQPERASLLELSATLLLSMDELDKARDVINRYVSLYPKSAAAQAQLAILIAASESGAKAVDVLQDALELLDEEMPLRVLEAVGAVGHALLQEGEIIAGRGHLMMYAAIAPEGNEAAMELLLRMNLHGGLPLLLREYLTTRSCPEDAPWAPEFAHAEKAMARGQWRAAEGILQSLREKAGPEPDIVYNLALVRGWLAKTQEFAEALHEYARLDIPEWQAVEAEALAQLINRDLVDPQVDTVRLVYQVVNEDELQEKLISDKRVENQPVHYDEQDEIAERPRSSYVLLSNPIDRISGEFHRENVARVLAFMSLHGKRTDREAQLIVTTDRNEQFDQTQEILQEVTEGTLGELIDDTAVISRSVGQNALSWRWRLPPSVTPSRRAELVAEERRLAILERWTHAPRAVLGGKTPLEAAGDPELLLPLMGSVLVLEQAAEAPEELAVFPELRELLKLPAATALESDAVDDPHFTIVRVPRLDLSQLSDDQLEHVSEHAMMLGANLTLQLISREQVARAENDPQRDVRRAYLQLIKLESIPEHAFDWVEKARAWARSRNASEAEWVLSELEVALKAGNSQVAQRALGEIREKYLDNEAVAEAVYRLLYEAGVLDPNRPTTRGAPATPESIAPTGAATGEKKLWTPDDDSVGEPAPQGESKALWTP